MKSLADIWNTMNEVFSVRNMRKEDIDLIADYWLGADAAFMEGMGVDLSKIPSLEEWRAMLESQLRQPLEQKQSYCLIWEANGIPAGHSNINKIVPGEEAYLHLHLWKSDVRKRGMGTELVKLSLPFFFEAYKLKKLLCEPYALNPAPNKTLEKLGFQLVDTYTTTPGWINFEQPVNRWILTYRRFMQIVN